ncbi:hypothetical protein SAMN04487905_12024 [Actinopolyspora xinjiangensis]|uniref:Uncharacterized protein n=1 Tax=Actinopolyspora xinjiangensis TaxID=405564 RepID=A0A1H0X0H0_9ACTN|nr:hypothetical protein [Actinopolyspora xinjiangensis]SDP96402.1 hypothetical protein SAMN04487905_12024 [Actinopolyspora xinjiangensis]
MPLESRTLTDILETTSAACAPVFDQMAWCEDEIQAAQRRHPHAADTLYHSWTLLHPTTARMSTEFVYRSHGREILERVAAGEDTRPGSAAEIVIALCEVAKTTPITTAAEGVLFRLWAEAFPDQQDIDLHRSHRETLYNDRIDDVESLMRSKTSVTTRTVTLAKIECHGRHHGERVTCSYAPNAPSIDESSSCPTWATR